MKDEKEDRIPLRSQVVGLLVNTHDSHRSRHDIDPSFQGDNLEQYEDRSAEGVKAEVCSGDLLRI
jgi:hypothetical protein